LSVCPPQGGKARVLYCDDPARIRGQQGKCCPDEGNFPCGTSASGQACCGGGTKTCRLPGFEGICPAP
jgi:hypothetical protein